MKIDSLPDPLPSLPGTMWINAATARLMISDGEGFIPLAVLRKSDEPRLAALIAELAVPSLDLRTCRSPSYSHSAQQPR